MYIINMKFGNKIFFSPVLALVLFACGAVVPVFFENDVAIALCFVPFYGYAFYKSYVCSEKFFSKGAVRRQFFMINFVVFLVAAIASLGIGIEFVSLALLANSVVAGVSAVFFAIFAVWAGYNVDSADLSMVFAEEIVE